MLTFILYIIYIVYIGDFTISPLTVTYLGGLKGVTTPMGGICLGAASRFYIAHPSVNEQ